VEQGKGKWTISAAAGRVCVSSKPAGACSRTDSHEQAANLCAAEGARLCSANEVFADVAKGSGCKADRTLVWVDGFATELQECSDGTTLLLGGSSAAFTKDGLHPTCWPMKVPRTASVRCCADVSDSLP
jgi:hypothetical protein